MYFNKFYILSIIILGILLLYSYYYYSSVPEFMQLWGGISKQIIPIYVVSMLISAAGFLTFLYYIYVKNIFTKEEVLNIFMLSLIIIFFSIFWTPYSILYLQNKDYKNKIIVLLILFIVALSCFGLFYNVYKIQDKSLFKKFVDIGLFYFFFHTFVLDFCIWSYNFFI